MKMRRPPALRTLKATIAPIADGRGSDGVARSPAARERNRLYHTARWKRMRSRFLGAHPLCVLCEAEGYTVPATVVDHSLGHAGDWQSRFWDSRHWRPLCARHHNRQSGAEGRERERDTAGGFDRRRGEGPETFVRPSCTPRREP